MKASYKWLAGGAAAAIVTLLWPGPPAGADTSLGGYTATSTAAAVHVEVFDPTIPIPAEPQGDLSFGFTASNVDSGPTSRALSSYLWPGYVIGDGFDQLLKNPNAIYPLRVDSRYPETTQSPAKNTIQITDGNGMTTSTDGYNTKSTVTLLGLAGKDTDVFSGVGTGLPKLLGKDKTVPQLKPLPVPVSDVLGALVSAQNVTSTSTTTVADKTVTSVAHAAVSELSLLNGIITIDGLDVTSTVVSDGTKATATSKASIGGLKVLGVRIGIDDDGINLGLPALSKTVTTLLGALGLGIDTLPVTKTVDGATGSSSARALSITVDTRPLKKVVDSIIDPLVKKLPQGTQDRLAPILGLGPKIVFTVGTSNADATAAPAFNDNFPSTGGGAVGGGDNVTGLGNGNTGGNGALPNSGDIPPTQTSGNPQQTAPVAYSLPKLADVPRMLILGGLLLAAAIGWAISRGGGLLLGAAASCDYGLTTGVPDLRKG
ncbi:MAG TPA: choice-of-anchor P family protein [Jatrophihabitantaceae bacterium]|nr:choice-of-anchor P family protein [Jatrophihabitantaceae bacterium]